MKNREIIKNKLAINGGQPVRTKPMPPRLAFGKDEQASVIEVMEYYSSRQQDPPYNGIFEKKFCDEFAEFQGGGYADAVASGTISVFIALAALQLPAKSEVIISPVTDTGPLHCITMLGLTPVVADSTQGSYNMGVDQFLQRITSKTSAVLVVHCAGEPLEIDSITEEAHKRGIRVVEDCSQAPGALWKGERVGTFGDIAAFSTMYRKTLTAGATGGLVYSKDLDLFHFAHAYADRGRPTWNDDYNPRKAGDTLALSLNFHTDELSCAIGLASLNRLQESIDKRVTFLSKFVEQLEVKSKVCQPYAFTKDFSPFFFPVFVDEQKISCSKIQFAEALLAEGIDLSPHYGCVISSWNYAQKFLSDNFVCKNALNTRTQSFNLFLNENYGDREVLDIVNAIVKVEKYYYKEINLKGRNDETII